MNKKIENLIAKYFDQSLSKEEAKELVEWIEKGNKDVFNEYVMINFTIDEIELLRQGPATDLWESIYSKINKPKKVLVLKPWKYVAVAATIALLISFPFMFNTESTINEFEQIKPGTDKAILTLENGKQVALKKGEEHNLPKNRSSNGEELVYNTSDKLLSEDIQYNYLTIPKGGQFFIQLSDGTKVWLNSDSKIKYPVNFISGKTREVELLYGEAYFDVSPSKNHKGAAFKVKNQVQNIKVLGTEFNIKAYQDGKGYYTTLVEGSVAVGNDIVNKILKPGEQSIINKKSEKISIKKVDIAHEIAWKNGYFSFDEASLENIMTELSRWYNVEVVFENPKLKKLSFTGVLKRTDSVESFLKIISETNNEEAKFEIKNDIITIK